jgi:hypothetical protein
MGMQESMTKELIYTWQPLWGTSATVWESLAYGIQSDGVDLDSLGYGSKAGICAHRNELSGCIKVGGFFLAT